MSCPAPDELARAAGGTGDSSERRSVLDHAAACEECHAALLVLGASTGDVTTSTSPGTAAREAAPPRPGTMIDRYLLGDELGRGAMGVVYSAHDQELDREVAVKVLRASASAARLRREAQALARLTHPNVVRVYDVGEHEGQAFVAMELVRGSNLRHWLRTSRSVDEILAVLRRAGEGLAAAHRAGLVHRDVKPDNMFVADDGGVLVGDFGLARAAEPPSQPGAAMPVPALPLSDDNLTATGAVVGTPAYMAPEQSAGDATTASDQFGFCVTAWEALYGQRPFVAPTMRDLREQVRAGAIATPPGRSDVPARVVRALRRGLSPAPSARFSSMDALLAALTPAARSRALLPVAAVALIGGIGVAWAVMGRERGGARDRETACSAAAAVIDADWTPQIALQITARSDGATTAALAYYVDRWRERRLAACRAGKASEPQVACLERARVSFRQTVAGVVAASTTLQPEAIARVLPALERCDASTVQAGPPPAVADKVAALDARIATLELSAFTRVPVATRDGVAALLTEAKTLGYRPQVLRVQLLDGMVAALLRDDAAAIASFREVMVAAEADADDFLRARAGAHLALLQARQRSPETTSTITSARAALARAGADTSIELLLLAAEAGYAFGRNDFHASALAHERIIEISLVQFGPDAPLLGEEYGMAAGSFAIAGEPERAAARYTDMSAWFERELRRKGAGAAEVEAAAQYFDPMQSLVAGDFAGARLAAQRRLAQLRALPEQNLMLIADTVNLLGRIGEFAGDCNEALGWYQETVALYRRPIAELAANSDAPDPDAIATGIVDGLLGQSSCYFNLDQPDRAVAVAREAVAEAHKGGATTANDLPTARRWLGQALSATGRHAEAIELLTPIVETFPTSDLKPYAKGLADFCLARSLWAAGGARDRERALVLADDAERELKAALAASADPAQPFLRTLAPLARKQLDAVAAWRAAR